MRKGRGWLLLSGLSACAGAFFCRAAVSLGWMVGRGGDRYGDRVMVALCLRCWGEIVSDDGIFFSSSISSGRTAKKKMPGQIWRTGWRFKFQWEGPLLQAVRSRTGLGSGRHWEGHGAGQSRGFKNRGTVGPLPEKRGPLDEPCLSIHSPTVGSACPATLEPLHVSSFPSQTRRSEVGSGRLFAQHLFFLLWTVYFSTTPKTAT
jgi:hypothetical protein